MYLLFTQEVAVLSTGWRADSEEALFETGHVALLERDAKRKVLVGWCIADLGEPAWDRVARLMDDHVALRGRGYDERGDNKDDAERVHVK